MSSHHAYLADQILPRFALEGRRNIHGWGIGSFSDGHAEVLRSEEPATKENLSEVTKRFRMAVESARSNLILGHLRLTSSGSIGPENNHPFKLSFLGYDWLLVHNGTASDPDSLVRPEERLLSESDNDTARVFEFLRKRIIDYLRSRQKHSLMEACRRGYQALLQADREGSFNLIFSNGYLSFIFVHFRPFHLLMRKKPAGDVTFISTLHLTGEGWQTIQVGTGKQAKMLVFSGPTLVLNWDIPE